MLVCYTPEESDMLKESHFSVSYMVIAEMGRVGESDLESFETHMCKLDSQMR